MPRWPKLLALTGALAVILACGGGGGATAVAPPPGQWGVQSATYETRQLLGTSFTVQVLLKATSGGPYKLTPELVNAPPDWTFTPDTAPINLPAGGETNFQATIAIPNTTTPNQYQPLLRFTDEAGKKVDFKLTLKALKPILGNFHVTGGKGDAANDPENITITLDTPPAAFETATFTVEDTIEIPPFTTTVSIDGPADSVKVQIPKPTNGPVPIKGRKLLVSLMDGATKDTTVKHDVVFNTYAATIFKAWKGSVMVNGQAGSIALTFTRGTTQAEPGAKHAAAGQSVESLFKFRHPEQDVDISGNAVVQTQATVGGFTPTVVWGDFGFAAADRSATGLHIYVASRTFSPSSTILK